MLSMRALVLVAFCSAVLPTASAEVKLTLTDNMKLPVSYAGNTVSGAKTFGSVKRVMCLMLLLANVFFP